MTTFNKQLLDDYVENRGFSREKHPKEDLYIYGYSTHTGGKTWDDLNINLRGLIINGNAEIQARSFKKFFTFKSYLSENVVLLNDNQIANIPSLPFRIYEKLDGTIAILYWINDIPYLATQRSFSCTKAKIATELLHEKYSHVFPKLKRDRTYLFEVINPQTRVIVDYGDAAELILIGVLDNKTGTDCPLENIGFRLPYEFTSDLKFVKNFYELQNLNLPNKEGFVLVFENGFRIKIKFPWYRDAHKLMSQLISLNKLIYKTTLQLKAKLNIPKTMLTKDEILRLHNENKLNELLVRIPHVFFHFGFENWVSDIIHSTDFGNEDLPSVFDIKNANSVQSDSVMWNFMNRLNSTYD